MFRQTKKYLRMTYYVSVVSNDIAFISLISAMVSLNPLPSRVSKPFWMRDIDSPLLLNMRSSVRIKYSATSMIRTRFALN